MASYLAKLVAQEEQVHQLCQLLLDLDSHNSKLSYQFVMVPYYGFGYGVLQNKIRVNVE